MLYCYSDVLQIECKLKGEVYSAVHPLKVSDSSVGDGGTRLCGMKYQRTSSVIWVMG